MRRIINSAPHFCLFLTICIALPLVVVRYGRNSFESDSHASSSHAPKRASRILPLLSIDEKKKEPCFQSSSLIPKYPNILKSKNTVFGICHSFLAGSEHLEAFESVLEKPIPGLFVDIGANAGVLSMLAASLGRKVVAFEMIPGNVLSLTSTIGVNRFWDRITIVGLFAASEKSGSTILARDNLSGSQLNGQVVQAASLGKDDKDIREFPTISVAEVLYNYENIFLMKMDVEGSEGLVAKSMAPLLEKGKISMIHSEYAPDNIVATSGVDPLEYLYMFHDKNYWVLFDSCIECPQPWSFTFHQDTLSLVGASNWERVAEQILFPSVFEKFTDSLRGWHITNVLFIHKQSDFGQKIKQYVALK